MSIFTKATHVLKVRVLIFFLIRTAGSDTTANSSAAILFHILRNPRVHKALLEELSQLEIEEGEDGLVLPSHDQVGYPIPQLSSTWPHLT